MNHLSSPDLDSLYRKAVDEERAALEYRLSIEEERFRRYRVINMLRQLPDWPGGDPPTPFPLEVRVENDETGF